jgi:hypothetical protein
MVFESVEISTPAEESPAVSWPAIAAGAIAAAALTLVLLAFGAGMEFSAVSPWGNSGISASTFHPKDYRSGCVQDGSAVSKSVFAWSMTLSCVTEEDFMGH